MVDMTAIGLFTPVLQPPFIESVRRYQATTPLVGIAKRRFFGDGFGTRIEHTITHGYIPGPGWNQALTVQVELTIAERQYRSGWSDIVAWCENIGWRGIVMFHDIAWIGIEKKSSTHSKPPNQLSKPHESRIIAQF